MTISRATSGRAKAIIVGIAFGLAIQMGINWWKIYAHHSPDCGSRNCIADFVPFYAQTVMIWENPRGLYEIDQQRAYQRRIAPYERVLHSPYPPIAVALFAPLGRLSFSNAFLAMTVINVLLLAISLQQLTRHLRLSSDQTHWLLLFSICNFGVHATLSNAQSSFIVLLLFSKFVLAQKTVDAKHSGVWAGMLCVKPQYLLIPQLVLLLRRNWKESSIGILLAAGLTAGSFGLLGMKAFTDFLQILHITATENTWANPFEAMHNLKALTTVWLPTPWNPYAWWTASAIVLTTTAWINLRPYPTSYGFDALWISNSFALLLLSPHLFTHDVSLLIVPCALFLSAGKKEVRLREGIGLILLAMLPTVNYLFPTIVALALVVSFLLSLTLLRSSLAPRDRVIPLDTAP